MIEWLDKLPTATRKVLIHINNTNPILDEDSEQRATLRAHRIEVSLRRHGTYAYDAKLAMMNDTRPRWSAEEFEAKLRDKGTSYHIYHPFHVMMAEGKLTQKQIAGLGRQPLLLPDRDPGEGRGDPVQLPGPRDPPRVDPAHPRPRRLRDRRPQGSRRHRGLDTPGRGRRPHARRCDLAALSRAGRAFRGRRLRQLRAPPALAGSDRIEPDRAVRAAHPPAAHRHLAGEISVGQDRGHCSTSATA